MRVTKAAALSGYPRFTHLSALDRGWIGGANWRGGYERSYVLECEQSSLAGRRFMHSSVNVRGNARLTGECAPRFNMPFLSVA
jgi:hypothetical protein